MPQVAKPTKIEPGILSCLTSLNIDDVSQYKEKETPTPSGIAECKINIMKMLDDSVSSKPIMQKTAESTNCKNSNKERTSFSTYIKQNSFNDTSNMYFNMNVNMNVINSHPVNIFNSYNTFNDNTFDINNNLTYNNIFQMNPFIYNSNLQIKNKQRYYSSMSLSQIVENSNIISRDQSGCRYLQKILTENPSIAPQLLKNAFEKIYEIVTDSFGNYLIQKLFDYMNQENFCQFMALIQIDLYQICINSYGTRVIQKLLDYLNTTSICRNFITIIKPIVKDIIIDINGSHIVLKMIDNNKGIYSKVIYNEIKENIINISTHKHGCCVLQKCIERASQNAHNELCHIIVAKSRELIIDQCGNYIIQYIISLNDDEINTMLINLLIQDIEKFSKQKFSSNVVEKCFECCDNRQCGKLISALYNERIILSLLFDKFGNYVIQKALQRSNDKEREYILNVIAPHMHKLKNYSFGIKLYSKLIITYSYLSKVILVSNANNN